MHFEIILKIIIITILVLEKNLINYTSVHLIDENIRTQSWQEAMK